MSVVLEMSYLFILLVCHCVNSIHYFTSDESIIADDKYYKLIQKKVWKLRYSELKIGKVNKKY